jgi:carboxypeptidase C (cathepsin A)
VDDAVNSDQVPEDQPFHDETSYSYEKDDSVSDADAIERAAITHKKICFDGRPIFYTTQAGHLVTRDKYSAKPVAKIFYVAFTAKSVDDPSRRPITFFYNGGPGSSSVFLLLGSFGPRRIETSLPHYTPPAPYKLVNNEESLLDCTDLVFINPVGTAYSTAIAPKKNSDFWGVDEDAVSIKQFIKRYLTVFNRWNSPKFLFGESYGTPRTCVLTWLLHEEGVDLNGIVLQSSILDYSRGGDAVGLLPTFAADALYHKEGPPKFDVLKALMDEVAKFAQGDYKKAKDIYPAGGEFLQNVLAQLSKYLRILPDVLRYWKLDPATPDITLFLTSLLTDTKLAGQTVSAFDGRVTAEDTGIAASPSIIKSNDPAMMSIGGVYTTMWNVYLNNELQFTSTTPFMTQNNKVPQNWNFGHIDPAGAQRGDPTAAQRGGGDVKLYTAGDLAAAMELNPYLKVFSANGYYDAVTPFFQTKLNFDDMLCGKERRDEIKTVNYASGHMIYLDNDSRRLMKQDLARFYKCALRREKDDPRTGSYKYTRQIGRTPY